MGLHGDAFLLAHDLGHNTLMTPGRVVKLFEAIKRTFFPRAGEEACELLREGQRAGGVLSRQSGDRCSVTPQDAAHGGIAGEAGPTIQFSEEMRSERVLEPAGLSWQEVLVIKSRSSPLMLEASAETLVEQYSTTRVKEGSRSAQRISNGRVKPVYLVSFLTGSWRLG